MTNLKLTRPIAFIDIETTGTNQQQDKIVEICIIKINPDGTEEILDSLIDPKISIPLEATNVHGIKDVDVKGKPTFEEFAKRLIDFIGDCDIGGFSTRFDLTVLESEFKRIGVNYSTQGIGVVDVKSVYHKLDPRDLSGAHLKYCGRSLEGAHRAQVDVRATIDVLESQLQQNDFLPRDISGLYEFCNPKDPTWIDDDGKFAWLDGKVVINFGKNQGKTLEYMSKNDSSWLRWVIGGNFSAKVKEIANEAINGKFPKSIKTS